MCRGSRITSSKELTIRDLYGIIAELQVEMFEGRRVLQAKNIPTSLFAGQSGTSNSSSKLYRLPTSISCFDSTTSLLMKLHGCPTTSQLVKSHLILKEEAVLGSIAQYKPPYMETAKNIEKAETDTIQNNLLSVSPTQ